MAHLLAFDSYATDWLNLLARWLHVIAGIVWIGSSFYFIALDTHLRPPKDAEEGVGGESWEIHGGGFYRIHKFRVAPERLPDPLHWYQWEADKAWLSGFAVLVTLTAWGASQLFSPRASWLQTGAMLGTIMVANVFFVIIPGHWQLVRAKEEGRPPGPNYGIRGQQRAVRRRGAARPTRSTGSAASSGRCTTTTSRSPCSSRCSATTSPRRTRAST